MTDAFIKLGQVGVHTTENKGHDPEFWAAQVTNKICEYRSTLQTMLGNKL